MIGNLNTYRMCIENGLHYAALHQPCSLEEKRQIENTVLRYQMNIAGKLESIKTAHMADSFPRRKIKPLQKTKTPELAVPQSMLNHKYVKPFQLSHNR